MFNFGQGFISDWSTKLGREFAAKCVSSHEVSQRMPQKLGTHPASGSESRVKSDKRADKAPILFPVGLPTSRAVHYKAGETIFSQGDECTAVHYIKEGVVKLTLVSKRGRTGVLGFLGRGDFFGENCISSHAFYSTSAIAIVAGSIMVINRNRMQKMLEDEPAVCNRFINYLLARNHRIEQDLIDHLFNSSEKRLARTLLLLADYEAGNADVSIMSTINQDTLAEMVGTTRPRVNFFMNKFRRLGYIQYDKNGKLEVYKALAKVLHDGEQAPRK
jgi:CRP/FNR family cyclic AMP-dependent transcriptional regulator